MSNSATKPVYRAQLFMPRDLQSDISTEPDVLIPRAGAAHADPFRVTTLGADAWGRGYLDIPSGRRSKLNLRDRKVDVGGMMLSLLDKRLGSDNLERWITAGFLGDAQGVEQLGARLKVKVWQSLDGGCSFDPLYTGRTFKASKASRTKYNFELRDMASELQRDCFVGPPHADIDYAYPAPLLPYGLMVPFAGLPATPGPGPGLKATDSFASGRIRVQGSNLWDRYTLITEDLRQRASLNADSKNVLGLQVTYMLFDGERCKVFVTNGTTSGWFWLRRILAQVNAEGHFVARQIWVDELAAGSAGRITWASLGADGAALRYYVVANDKLSEQGALLIGPVHPVRLMKDLVDGKFGYLNADGSVRRNVPTNPSDARWAEMIADTSFRSVSFIVPAKAQLGTWIQDKLSKPFGACLGFDADGDCYPIDVRRPKAAYAGLPEFVDEDLVSTAEGEGWEQDSGGAITRVLVAWREDEAVDVVEEVIKAADAFPKVPAGLIKQQKQELLWPGPATGDDARLRAALRFGEQLLTIDAEGIREWFPIIFTTPTSTALPRARAIADDYLLPYLSGEKTITLHCKRTTTPQDCEIGDVVLISVSTIPDPTTNLYGETLLARCVERSENGHPLDLTFALLGLASLADPPALIGEPTNTADQPGFVDVPITLDAAGDPVEVWGYLTETSVSVRPADDDPDWFKMVNVGASGTTTAGVYPGGMRLWVKARSVPGLFGATGGFLQQPSAFVYPSDFAAVNDYVDIAGASGISGLVVSNVTAAGADLTWSGGEDTDRVVIQIRSGSGTPTEVWAGPLSNFNRFFRLQGLPPSTLFTAGVQMVDDQGGLGTQLTAEFTTLGGSLQLERPAGIDFVYWSSIEGKVFASSSYPIELQHAPDDSGPDLGNIENVSVGPDGAFYDPRPADQSLHHYRARHTPSENSGAGILASEWTDWLAAVARGTQGSGGGGTGNGDLPTDQQPSVQPGELVPILPTVSVARSDDGAGNCSITLTLTDPQGRKQRIEFQTQVGAGSPSAWAEDPTAPYTKASTYDASSLTVIRWRLIGFDARNLPDQTLAQGEEVFGGSVSGDAEFITNSPSAMLANERVLTNAADIVKNVATAGQVSLELTPTGVTPGVYGDATHTVQVEFDANGRAQSATEVAITGVDPGSTVGRPGNHGPFPFVTEAGGRYVIGNIPSALTPLDDVGQYRVDTRFANGITLYCHVLRAGPAGSYITVEYSPDNGSTWVPVGTTILLSSVGVKNAAGALPLGTGGAQGGSILFRASVGGGDETSAPAVYNFAMQFTVTESEVSPPPDLPDDEELGGIIDDRDAAALLLAGQVDGSSVTAWPDGSVSENPDAMPSAVDGQAAPVFLAEGMTGGLPCVQFTAAANHGLKIVGTQITGSSFSLYGVLEAIGTPGGVGIAAIWSSPEGHPFQKGWTALDPALNAGAAMGIYVPSGPSFANVADSWTRSTKHLYLFTFDKGSGAARLYVDDMTTPKIVLAGSPQFSGGTNVWIAFQAGLAPVSMKAGRFVTYGAAHSLAQRGVVKAALVEYWGTP